MSYFPSGPVLWPRPLPPQAPLLLPRQPLHLILPLMVFLPEALPYAWIP